MFAKLALRNVRRSFQDYGVYLLTLTFGVCLFYTFNSVEGQGAMTYLSQKGNPMVEPILMLINIFSVFVAVVLACLILYANRFLLRRRKRELGTYLLLGLSQGQVALLLFLETGIVGLLSLAVGLGLGILGSFGLSALTLSMFSADVSQMLALNFSVGAAAKTTLSFGL
ncbi:MAG: FtsX-like permease family protein, partial [Lawsonibacter sp.]|nr:FtsX-like permease family protein [Lawsonibacter sp.]